MENETGRSARKHEAIIAAARSVFLAKGFGSAGMDEVSTLAEVSKQTVYKHFADKKSLFSAVIIAEIEASESLTRDLVAGLSDSDDVEADLRTFARAHIAEVMQPHLIQFRRLVIAEADRFPELAKTWYASGPRRAHEVFAEHFRVLTKRGLLQVSDPMTAAMHLNWLVLSIPLNKAMFHGSDTDFHPDELRYLADEAVRVFMAAYGPA